MNFESPSRTVREYSLYVVSSIPLIYQIISSLLKFPSYNSIGGIAYKDATNWELCAKSLSISGEFPINIYDWCTRRPINIEILSILYSLFGSFEFIYLLFAILFTVSLIWVSKFLIYKFHYVVALLLLNLSVFLWIAFGNNMLLSESIALILGVISVGLYLRFREKLKILDLVAFLVTLVLIQLIRPGNILIFFAVLFLVWAHFGRVKIVYFLTSIVLLLPLIFTVLLKVVAKLLGYESYLTAGNTWATIFALIKNNSTWQEAYASVPRDFATTEILANNYLKSQSIKEFFQDPFNLALSLITNFYDMTVFTFPFFLPVTLEIPPILKLFVFGLFLSTLGLLVTSICKSREILYIRIFVLYVLISTLVFYSATWKSEAARALSPTLLLTIVICLSVSYRKSTILESDEVLKILKVKKFNSVAFKKSVVTILLPIIVITCTMVINRFPTKNHLSKLVLSKCSSNSFTFDTKSIVIVHTSEIKSVSFLGWSTPVRSLPSGYIIQGLIIIDADRYAFTGFLPDVQDLSHDVLINSCYIVNDKSKQRDVLEKLNFKEIQLFIS